MIPKLLVIFVLFAWCSCPSVANDVTALYVDSSTDEGLNTVFNAFSSWLTPFWHYATESVSSYEIYLTSLVFRTEFFFASIGEHVLPAEAVKTTPKDDVEHHITAMTAIELMKNLRTMERISSIIDNVTLEVAQNFFQKKRTGNPDHAHAHAMFENVNELFQNDIEFQSIKKKISQQYLELPEVNNFHVHSHKSENINLIMKIQSIAQNTQFLQLKLNTLFLKKSKTRLVVLFNTEENSKFMLANTLIQLAKDEFHGKKVQKLYNDAVYSVLKISNPWYMPVEAVNKLFKALKGGVDDDADMKKAFDVARTKISISVEDLGKYEVDYLF